MARLNELNSSYEPSFLPSLNKPRPDCALQTIGKS